MLSFRALFTPKNTKVLLDQTIALAALMQSTQLALQLAMNSSCDATDFEVCLQSLLTTDAPSTLAIYGDLRALKRGLNILSDPKKSIALQNDFYNVIWGSFRLAKALLAHNAVANRFKSHLSRIIEQSQYFGSPQHARVLDNLSDLYLELAKHCKLQLKLHGKPQAMRNLDNVIKVRVMLLAAVRAAVLWYQVGGNLFKLFWGRKKYKDQAQQLLKGL